MVIRPFLLGSAALAATAAFSAGCGSSASTVTATAPSSISRCSVTVNAEGQVPAQGGTSRLTVSAARECAWNASVESQWLSIKSGATGQGDGAVEVSAVANPDPQVRRGTAVVNEQRVDVMQAAGDCTYSLSEPSSSFGQPGGSGHFDVRASSQLCAWTATSDSPWIVVRSGASAKGTAAVQFDVAATTGAPRTGTITAAGLKFSVTQSAACAYTAAPLAHSVPTAGGVVTVGVTTAANCPWTVSSSDPWIGVSGPSSFTGPGTATFNVAAVAGAARTGTVVVAGQSVAISQGGGCAFAISPESASIPSAGGSGRVTVATGDGCAWTAASTVPWIQITDGASRTGNGEVAYQVAPTTGTRSGTMTIAGRTFTVNQSVTACAFSLSSNAATVPASGGIGTVVVNTSPECGWTASSSAPWLTITSGTSGTGTGTVAFFATALSSGSRTATLTIGGQTFTVAQAVSCTFAIAPEVINADAAGGSTQVAVTAPAGCAWTTSKDVGWLSLQSQGPETGNGVVVVTVSENKGAARAGTATIAGRTLTVNQAAAPCTYRISPTEKKVSASSNITKIDVRTAATCEWSATSNVEWIVVGAGATGRGDGETWISFAENTTGQQRIGTVTIAGQTFTLTQQRD
jgi:hypothetical protein